MGRGPFSSESATVSHPENLDVLASLLEVYFELGQLHQYQATCVDFLMTTRLWLDDECHENPPLVTHDIIPEPMGVKSPEAEELLHKALKRLPWSLLKQQKWQRLI